MRAYSGARTGSRRRPRPPAAARRPPAARALISSGANSPATSRASSRSNGPLRIAWLGLAAVIDERGLACRLDARQVRLQHARCAAPLRPAATGAPGRVRVRSPVARSIARARTDRRLDHELVERRTARPAESESGAARQELPQRRPGSSPGSTNRVGTTATPARCRCCEVVLVGVPFQQRRRIEQPRLLRRSAASTRGTRRCARRSSTSNAARRGRTPTSRRHVSSQQGVDTLAPGALQRLHQRRQVLVECERVERAHQGNVRQVQSPSGIGCVVSRARLRCGHRARAAPRGAHGACRRRARSSRAHAGYRCAPACPAQRAGTRPSACGWPSPRGRP